MGQPWPPSIKLKNIILILLLLTAFSLRLYRLDHQEIWGDEAHSAYVASLPLLSAVSPRTETNPPLYHLLLYFWVRLAGSSVFALRFLSLVLGVLTVPLVYRLARLAFGELVGLLAALLCAISPFQVYYSQEARMYALATFATALSMFLLARIVSGERGQFRLYPATEGRPRPDFAAEQPLDGAGTPLGSNFIGSNFGGQSRLRRFSGAVLPAGQPDNQGNFASRETNGNLRSLDILWLAYFLATAAAIFTHYYALFVVVAQNALVIALWRRDRGFDTPSATQPKGRVTRWLAVQVALALSYLPWVLAQRGFLGGKASGRFDELSLPVLISIVKRSLVAFSVGTTVEPPLAYYLTLAFLLLAALGLVAAVTVQRSLASKRQVRWDADSRRFSQIKSLCLQKNQRASALICVRNLVSCVKNLGCQGVRWQPWLLLAWLVIPLACAWLVNPIMPFFQERYLLIVAPAFITLVARGLGRCPDGSTGSPRRLAEGWMGGRSPLVLRPKDSGPWALMLGLLFVVSASSFSLHNWFFDDAYTKGEYKLVMDYVRDHAQPGDLLLLNNPLQESLFDYYRPPGVSHHLLSRHDLRTERRADQSLAALTEGYSRVWLVMFGYPEQYDPGHLAERWLSDHGYRSSYRSFLGAYLTLYVMSPADASFPMQHTVAANLDYKALLMGYGLAAQEIEAGGTLRLTLYWQALAEMDRRYTVFVHLLDSDNRIVAQMDSEPLGGAHPTTEWQFGEIVRDNYGLLIAPDTPPGEYLLEVGMYYLPTLDRLPVLDASGSVEDDRVVLGGIVVYRTATNPSTRLRTSCTN
ncbi:MAG: glycosyltransferase family 39 protein [Anaerolineae bacterium]|nr:glycosyltransferase family 39 protein [Anaerolineae bacterium]